MEDTLQIIKKFLPKRLFSAFQPTYHYLLAFFGAVFYRFPSRRLTVIVVTGTKGKSTVVELTSAILSEAGFKVASLSTIQFKIGNDIRPNLFKMTTPGRFFIQKFLREAVQANCTYAILEISSEAAKLFRHKFISLDALIFTNLSPEHIESHGSYEQYVAAKLSIGAHLAASRKPSRLLVTNRDDAESKRFEALGIPQTIRYGIDDAKPYTLNATGSTFTFLGERIALPREGLFNIYNSLAAATLAVAYNIPTETIKTVLERTALIRGRVEHVRCGQDFDVVVDYAHTADSLEKLYQTFPTQKKICILGNTGGGRDRWKRPEMGKIADTYCDEIILTNEDPYDEDPVAIIHDVARGITHKTSRIILDRREAIREALTRAQSGAVVLISGKGTDPYIMGAHGTKTPWDDATVVREELGRLLGK